MTLIKDTVAAVVFTSGETDGKITLTNNSGEYHFDSKFSGIKTQDLVYVNISNPSAGYAGEVVLYIAKESEEETSGIGLPKVTVNDNGKILRVVDGKWKVMLIPNAEGTIF